MYLHYNILTSFIKYLISLKLCIFILGINGRYCLKNHLLENLDYCVRFILYSIRIHMTSPIWTVAKKRSRQTQNLPTSSLFYTLFISFPTPRFSLQRNSIMRGQVGGVWGGCFGLSQLWDAPPQGFIFFQISKVPKEVP